MQLEVALPEEFVSHFATAFRQHFSEDCKIPEPVCIYSAPDGYRVKVSVHVSLEQKFYEFFGAWCHEHNLATRKDDLKPGQPSHD